MGEDKMGFTRHVEMGRVVIINYGADAGKLGMISDIIDQNRCMVYSPFTTLPRNEVGYKRLSLTDLTVKLQRGARNGTCKKAWEEPQLRLHGRQPPGARRSQHARGRP